MAKDDKNGTAPSAKGKTYKDVEPRWAQRPTPAEDAPNVVWILLDDLGFGHLGCYGSSINTPTIDRIAQDGLRYSNFHVTAMCSPTRTSLLTGRNHHAAGMGYLANFDTGYDNARGAVSPSCANMAEMLSDAGYGAYAVGKWHLTPPGDMTPAGPFENWPTQRGFSRFYGFLNGEDDQYTPELWYDQHHQPLPDNDAYHLSEDLVDRSIEFVGDHVTAMPERPFFLYLAFGAAHAPHQAPQSFRDRYKGKFDHGWDAEREKVLGRQKELGIVPPDTELVPRNPDVKPWSDYSPEAQRVLAKFQEAFAGFVEHTDAQIARLVEFLERRGLLSNTILMLLSDNGASGEAGEFGTVNEYRYFLGLDDSIEDAEEQIDEIGGPNTHNHYPSGWAQAGNTPLKFYKKFTFGGGVRAPLVVHWPQGLEQSGAIRNQFHHVIDLAPTILELCGVSPTATRRGVEQQPIHGTSLAYSFDTVETDKERQTQYFEMGGQRGIWHAGWKAVTNHVTNTSFDADIWELYNTRNDFNEREDLAPDNPRKVAELVKLWWREAERYGVLPLDDRAQARALALDPVFDSRTHFVLLPGSRLMSPLVAPNFSARPFTVTAFVDARSKEEDGVLFAYGHKAAGFSLFIQNGHLVFDYNLAGKHTVVESKEPIAPGAAEIAVSMLLEGGETRCVLSVDGQEYANEQLPRSFPTGFSAFSAQVGYNSPSPVSKRYKAPFRFGGRLDRVEVKLGEPDEDTRAGIFEAFIKSQ